MWKSTITRSLDQKKIYFLRHLVNYLIVYVFIETCAEVIQGVDSIDDRQASYKASHTPLPVDTKQDQADSRTCPPCSLWKLRISYQTKLKRTFIPTEKIRRTIVRVFVEPLCFTLAKIHSLGIMPNSCIAKSENGRWNFHFHCSYSV